jgi:hypothetical protein
VNPGQPASAIRISPPRLVLGWREWLSLPQLGLDCIRAKIDSGARSSSLHVLEQELFEREGRPFVRFVLDPGLRPGVRHTAEAEVIDQRVVTDSGGHRSTRIFIRTLLRLSPTRAWPIEINLTERCNMLFPMLLGRTALRRRCLVEPSRSFLLGAPTDIEPRS